MTDGDGWFARLQHELDPKFVATLVVALASLGGWVHNAQQVGDLQEGAADCARQYQQLAAKEMRLASELAHLRAEVRRKALIPGKSSNSAETGGAIAGPVAGFFHWITAPFRVPPEDRPQNSRDRAKPGR